jgi:hypothetical protein
MMLVQKHTEPDESFVIQGWRPEEGPPTRIRYNRDKLRYPSDLIDAEWSLLELLIPPA